MFWSMKYKKYHIEKFTKWKARLWAGGNTSNEQADYWSTYSPVVSCNNVCLMLVMALLNN